MTAGRSGSRAWGFGWLATFFAFAAVAHGSFETTDAAFTMHAARVLWVRGDSGLLRADQGGELLGERLGAADIHHHQSIGARRHGKVGTNGRAYVWFPMGHVWLLVPFAAAGEALTQALPAAEATFRARVAPGATDQQLPGFPSYVEGHPVLTQGLIALLLPPACAATMLLLLLALGRQLGASGRDAAIGASAIVFASQGFALGRETLSDGPGLVALLAALLAVVIVHQGRGTWRTAVLGGFAAGAAVVLRYPHALSIVALVIGLAVACHRQRRWRLLPWFLLGGLPLLVAFLSVNAARFGSALDTGYPEAGDWFGQPPWLGTAKILFGAGRGVLWLSPLLWLALPLAGWRAHTRELRWLAWALFLLPLLLFATANGWQGGRNWGCRYVTPGVVALLAIVLPQACPWRRWPKVWLLLLGFGLFANVTSVVAPVRGVLQLGGQAVQATGTTEDAADVTGWHPRYTPLLVNWLYAWRSRQGIFEDEHEQPRHGSAHTIEALFGIAATHADHGLAPMRWEDRCGRHLWWRFQGDLLAVPGWLLLLPVVLLAGCFAWLARRASTVASDSSTAR